MDGEFSPAELDPLHHTHPVHELMTDLVTEAELLEAEAKSSQEVNTPFPRAFRDLLDGLDLPVTGDGENVGNPISGDSTGKIDLP